MQRLLLFWVNLRSGMWFVPCTCVAVAIVLAVVMTWLDLHLGNEWTTQHSLLFGVGADGARGMLSSIAGSIMTVASLTFSVTITTLTLASSQYSSRLIRNFMRDKANQFVLGYFVGLFAYCLVVLRTIRSGDEWTFVPSLAVLTGLVLALISILMLIYFIHHIASNIQASVVLKKVTSETEDAIDHLFPKHAGDAADLGTALPQMVNDPTSVWHTVLAGHKGYVQGINADTLLEIAEKHGTIIDLQADIGEFLTPRAPVLRWLGQDKPDDDLTDKLQDCFSLGGTRTIEQDPGFGIRQIVDIALRALSPGVNDTTTGVMCVEHLGAVLEPLAARSIPSRLRSKDQTIRLIATGRTFEAFLQLSFDQIRSSGSDNVAVLNAILRVLEHTAFQTDDADRYDALLRQIELLSRTADRELVDAYDRQSVRDLLVRALRAVHTPEPDAAAVRLLPLNPAVSTSPA